MNTQKFNSTTLDEVVMGVSSASQLTDTHLEKISTMFNRYGMVCLAFDPRHRPVENLLMLSPLLGRPAPHNLVDHYGVYAIHERPNENSSYPGTSNALHPLHTDGAFLKNPEPIVGLQCVQSASQGGESVVASGWSVIDFIRKQKEADLYFQELQSDAAISIDRDNQSVKAPILEIVDGNYFIRYRHDTYASIRMKETLIDLDQKIIRFLNHPDNFLQFHLKPHQILLLDNRAVLHGRKEFEKSGNRLFHRMNFLGDGNISKMLRYGVPVECDICS